MTRTVTALLLLTTLLAGCASTQRTMLGPARAPLDPAEVRVYQAAPPGAVDVAELEVATGVGFGNPAQERAAIERLRKEAAALGANGLIIIGMGSSRPPVGVSVGAGSYGRHGGVGVGVGIPASRRTALAIAIYVPAAARGYPEPR